MFVDVDNEKSPVQSVMLLKAVIENRLYGLITLEVIRK